MSAGWWRCALCPARGTVTGWTRAQRTAALERELLRHNQQQHREKEQT